MTESDSGSDKIRFVHHSLRTYAVQVIATALSAVMTILTVRFLGPEGKGILSLLILIPVLTVMFGRAGIGYSLIYHAPRIPAPRLIFHGFLLTLVLGTAVTLAATGLVFWQKNRVFKQVPAAFLAVMCVMSLFYFLFDLAPFFLLATNKIDLRNLLVLIFPVAYLLFFLVFVLGLKKRLEGAVLAWSLAVLLPVAVSLVWMTKNSIWKDRSLNRPLAGQIMAFGLRSHPGTILEILNYRADYLIINLFAGPAAVGLYACAVNMAEVAWKLPEALTVVLLPKAAALPPDEARALTAKVGRIVWVLVLALFAVIVLLHRPIITVLFGQAFLPSARPFLILVPGFIAFSFWKILSYGLIAQGHPKKYSLTSGLAFAIMIAADFLLIPKWGLAGAAWASTAAYLLATAAILIIYKRTTKTPLRDLLFPYKSDWAPLVRFIKAGKGRNRVTPGPGSGGAG